jgi:hypothetical protein
LEGKAFRLIIPVFFWNAFFPCFPVLGYSLIGICLSSDGIEKAVGR